MRGVVAFCAAWCLIGTARGAAQNRGVYPLGMSATNSGVTPQSGFTYANQLLVYVRNREKDNNGNTIPVAGLHTVVMDMNSFIWVSDGKVFGAKYSVTATVPIAKNSLVSDVAGKISGGSGLADSYFLPVILGWTGERIAARAMYGILAPTGRFRAEATNNVGSGYWTHTLSSGQTFYLTASQKVALSAFEMYELHAAQEGTGIHPGDTFDLDYSLLGTLVDQGHVRLQLGAAGYLQRQTTARSGPEVDAAASATRYAVNGLGLAGATAFPKAKATLTLKYFDEFANRATFQGYSAQVAASISF